MSTHNVYFCGEIRKKYEYFLVERKNSIQINIFLFLHENIHFGCSIEALY